MDGNDKCSEEEGREIKTERRARAGQSNCRSRSVPHSRAKSHFLAWKRARVEWGPCLCTGGLCARSRRGLGLLQGLVLERAPSSGRSGHGTDRDCGLQVRNVDAIRGVQNRATCGRLYVVRTGASTRSKRCSGRRSGRRSCEISNACSRVQRDMSLVVRLAT